MSPKIFFGAVAGVSLAWMLLSLFFAYQLVLDYRNEPKLYRLAEINELDSQLDLFYLSINSSYAPSSNVPAEFQGVDNNATYKHYFEVSQRLLIPWFKLTMVSFAIVYFLLVLERLVGKKALGKSNTEDLGTMVEEVRDNQIGGKNGKAG